MNVALVSLSWKLPLLLLPSFIGILVCDALYGPRTTDRTQQVARPTPVRLLSRSVHDLGIFWTRKCWARSIVVEATGAACLHWDNDM